jgi:hypothetical protein
MSLPTRLGCRRRRSNPTTCNICHVDNAYYWRRRHTTHATVCRQRLQLVSPTYFPPMLCTTPFLLPPSCQCPSGSAKLGTQPAYHAIYGLHLGSSWSTTSAPIVGRVAPSLVAVDAPGAFAVSSASCLANWAICACSNCSVTWTGSPPALAPPLRPAHSGLRPPSLLQQTVRSPCARSSRNRCTPCLD